MKAKLKKLSHESLICRDLTHAWKGYDVKVEGGYYIRTLVCLVCETIRIDKINKRGKIISRTYRYPNGYLLTDGLGGNFLSAEDRAEIRIHNLRAGV